MAATAAGAFTLTENSLYTVEAWKLFFNHLTPQGVLTVSRWYSPSRPEEIYRLIVLATAALQQQGITDFRQHIVVVTAPVSSDISGSSISTLLVSKKPFQRKI